MGCGRAWTAVWTRARNRPYGKRKGRLRRVARVMLVWLLYPASLDANENEDSDGNKRQTYANRSDVHPAPPFASDEEQSQSCWP